MSPGADQALARIAALTRITDSPVARRRRERGPISSSHRLLAIGYRLFAPARARWRDSRLSGQAEEDTISRLNSVSAYDYIQALYRLCLVQSGSATPAEKAVRDIVSNAFRKANRELEKVDFNALFRSAFEQHRSYGKSSGTELTGWPQRLHLLPEPQRSTLTLFYLEILPPALIADIANLSLEQLAETVRDGRSALEAAGK
jgi:hypothetical protein